jgi:hypothetical protein
MAEAWGNDKQVQRKMRTGQRTAALTSGAMNRFSRPTCFRCRCFRIIDEARYVREAPRRGTAAKLEDGFRNFGLRAAGFAST